MLKLLNCSRILWSKTKIPSSSSQFLELRHRRVPKMEADTLKKFLKSMTHVYGPFTDLTENSAESWIPGNISDGHKGRYLWTDGFAVVNFLTLFNETKDRKYLICAEKLIDRVHNVLGYTRDGKSRLSAEATAENPLLGGLRIGKMDAGGEDGDGQYFHYLTVWIFALLQAGNGTGNDWYIKQAHSLASVIHPKFMYQRNSNRPRMYWKMSMDLKEPLVLSEGNLDPIDGYVVYSLVQKTVQEKELDLPSLAPEIQDYEKILKSKYPNYSSHDTLDLGMTLWTTHWLLEEEKWSEILTKSAVKCLVNVANERKYFDRPLSRRLAFREFGTVLGIKSHPNEQEITHLAQTIVQIWENYGAVPEPKISTVPSGLESITLVMYATAIFPGAFTKNYWNASLTFN